LAAGRLESRHWPFSSRCDAHLVHSLLACAHAVAVVAAQVAVVVMIVVVVVAMVMVAPTDPRTSTRTLTS
jgi:hypothetical protein